MIRMGGFVLTPPDRDGVRFTAKYLGIMPRNGMALVEFSPGVFAQCDPKGLTVIAVSGVVRAKDMLSDALVAHMLAAPASDREGDR